MKEYKMKTCKICNRPFGTQEINDSLPENDDAVQYCWRDWNPYSDCHDMEEEILKNAVDNYIELKHLRALNISI